MRVLSILLLITMFICSFSQLVLATDVYPDPNSFDNRGSDQGIDQVSDAIGSILNIVRTIAVGVAVIMLIVLAIKYISAAPSEKAEIKKSATIYVVGAVLLFAASGILTIIQGFASNFDA